MDSGRGGGGGRRGVGFRITIVFWCEADRNDNREAVGKRSACEFQIQRSLLVY